MNNKKILIIVATHGNEKIGVEVVKSLAKKGLSRFFDYLVANPKAFKKGLEFIDINLNRSYPGKKDSSLYEEQKAYENFQIIKKYQYIIDIHEASCGRDDFIIVPKKKLPKLFPLDLINLKKVLLWPYPKGPVTQFLENGIELEFGMKNRDRENVVSKASRIMEIFIKKVEKNNFNYSLFPKKDVYYVYGKLMWKRDRINMRRLRDFREVLLDKERFYPLLVGQYLKYGIVCYKMRIIRKTL